MEQAKLFEDKIEFEYVQTIIGSGYEQQVAKLAIEDGVALAMLESLHRNELLT